MLFREKKNMLYAGIDLNNRTSQISTCSSEHPVPETMSLASGKSQFNFPTVLCKRSDVNQWFFGKEAIRHAQEGDGVLIENLLDGAYRKESIELDGEEFEMESLLALFVRQSLAAMMLGQGVDKPHYLMITVENLDYRMVELLTTIGNYMQFDREHIFFESHEESFFQYVMHQPEELRMHEVMICDYTEKHMKTYRLESNHHTTPIVSFVDKKEFPQMKLDRLPEQEERREVEARKKDAMFCEILHEVMDGKLITCAYLIGDEYSEEWCKDSLKLLCSKRRVFQGNNLYSKGACYGAYDRVNSAENRKKNLFLGQDKVKVNIGIELAGERDREYLALVDAGVNWYDVHGEWEFLLESGTDMQFILTPLTGKEKKRVTMELTDLPTRPENATRLQLKITFAAENKPVFTVKDLGFGDFFQSSGLVWEDTEEI